MEGRKIVELREKVAGVGAEFDRWMEDTGQGQPLRKHQSQIERLTLQLRELAKRTEQEIDIAAASGDVLAACREVQLRILEVHRLWDFYRSKFSLRHVNWFRRYLLVADELAWVCYRPAQKYADPAVLDLQSVKAPPLVFLSGEFSPFIHYRQEPFTLEDVPDALDSDEFLRVAHALPVPVIGLPWYQVVHLPDLLLLAHEVGHTVERDFGLAGVTEKHLGAALSDVPGPRQDAWFGWLPEVFADIFGVLAGGPAFVSALSDLLATDPVEVAAESAEADGRQPHPPATLRVALCGRTLEHLGFETEASSLWGAWADAFTPDPDDPYGKDVEVVADGLRSARYPQLGCRTLREILPFSAAHHKAATTAAISILEPSKPTSADIRSLVAAARLAFDRDPEGYRSPRLGMANPQDLILDRAEEIIGDRPRGDEDVRPTPEADRRAGAALYDLITTLTQDRRSTATHGGKHDPEP
jgi:hypothetical protein